ncbi:MAG: winged helix-turn-helix domain-containing protein [Pseudomonadota bacterium]
MTKDFEAGVDWLLKMQNVFSCKEALLIWTLLKADGVVVTPEDLEFAVTGRRFTGSNVLNVHVSRARVRARAMGLDIVTVRGSGYRIDVQPSSSFYSEARAIPQQEKAA